MAITGNRITQERSGILHDRSFIEIEASSDNNLTPFTCENNRTGETSDVTKFAQIVYVANPEDIGGGGGGGGGGDGDNDVPTLLLMLAELQAMNARLVDIANAQTAGFGAALVDSEDVDNTTGLVPRIIQVPSFWEGSIHTFGTSGVTYKFSNSAETETIEAGENISFESLSDDPRFPVPYDSLTITVAVGARVRIFAKALPNAAAFDIVVI